MKSNFVKPSVECKAYHEMLGIPVEQWSKKQNDFQDAVREGKIHNSAQIAEWCIEYAETTEEAILLAVVCTKIMEKINKNPLEALLGGGSGDMLKTLALLKALTEDDDEEEHTETKEATDAISSVEAEIKPGGTVEG